MKKTIFLFAACSIFSLQGMGGEPEEGKEVVLYKKPTKEERAEKREKKREFLKNQCFGKEEVLYFKGQKKEKKKKKKSAGVGGKEKILYLRGRKKKKGK